MKKTVKRIIAIVMTMCTIVALTGCKKYNPDDISTYNKKQLVEAVGKYQSELELAYSQLDEAYEEINQNEDKIAELNEKVVGVQEERKPTPGIRDMSDNTGRKTLFTVDGALEFVDELVYPGSTETSSTASVNITKDVSISPRSPWVCELYGYRIDLSYSDKINGQIKVGFRDNESKKTPYEDCLACVEQWLSSLTVTTKSYSNIFIDGKSYGVDVIFTTFVDDKETTFRCGIAGFGDVSIQYSFYYLGNDSTYDDIIRSVLTSLAIFNKNISISS